jgi:phosphomannomutase
MCRVGHSFIKEQMRKENACFAGELSGHYYFRDNFFTDSTDIPLLMIISLLSSEKIKLSEIADSLKKYYHSGEINTEVQDKEAVFKRIKEKYFNYNIIELDGISIIGKDFWFNLRASNTEPLIRLNLEADTNELMKSKIDEIMPLIC